VFAAEGVEPPETILAEVGDPSSLRAMASRATVVVNPVGPYTLHGEPVIEACVDGGCHYVDLTGEIPFVRRMNAAFDARARAAGVKIVQVCGFEALPPDLGIALAADAAAKTGDHLVEVDLEAHIVQQPMPPRLSDAFSGGTLQSIAAVAGDPEIDCIVDPGCLVPDPATAQAVRVRSPIRVRPRRRDGAVIAPMSPAAFINPAVIHRAAALRAEQDGKPLTPFTYREGLAIEGSMASLPLRYVVAGGLSSVQGLISMLARAHRPDVGQTVSRFLTQALPGSGYGPARERLEPWRWQMAIRARTSTGQEMRCEINADGHPGYLTTPRILGEAGLLLSETGSTPDRYGCLTPSAALGTPQRRPLCASRTAILARLGTQPPRLGGSNCVALVDDRFGHTELPHVRSHSENDRTGYAACSQVESSGLLLRAGRSAVRIT
jgi:short subunit dehydrogenase-like uncharacterized protein